MASLIKIDGTVVEVKPAGDTFTLAELYALVCPDDPDPIVQAVPVVEGEILWCHEEGKLRNLPLNEVATRCYQRYLFPGDFLVGNILITSPEEVD
jgi:hypothetical protein